MTFTTLHWHLDDLGDPALNRAAAELTAPGGAAGRAEAFLVLLRSGRPPAVGIALDHYSARVADGRWGADNPFEQYDGEVLTAARQLLRLPPVSAGDAPEKGASHASALLAIWNLAEPADAELIAQVIASGTTDQLDVALTAAGEALDRSAEPHPRLVELLTGIVFDESAPFRDRGGALSALGYARSETAVEAVVRAMALSDLRLQAHAALILAHGDLETHRAAIDRVVAGWPTDGDHYPASEVRDFLEEADAARAAAGHTASGC